MKNFKNVYVYLIFIFFTFPLLSMENVPHEFIWEKVKGAGSYKLELKDKKGIVFFTKILTTNKLNIPLYPDIYQYKITSLNNLGLEEGSSEWEDFIVFSTVKPKFISLVVNKELSKSNNYTAVLKGEDLSGNLIIEAELDKKRVILEATAQDKNTWLVELPKNLKNGNYNIILTNLKNLVTVSSKPVAINIYNLDLAQVTNNQGSKIQNQENELASETNKFFVKFIEPKTNYAGDLPLVLTLFGENFTKSNGVKLSLVNKDKTKKIDNKLDLNFKVLSDKKISIEAISKLEPGQYQIEISQANKTEIVKDLSFTLLEDTISRQLVFGAGLGYNATIYEVANYNIDLQLNYYFTEHKRPYRGVNWDFGIFGQFKTIFSQYFMQSNNQLSFVFNPSLGPSFELQMPELSIYTRVGFGAGFNFASVGIPNSVIPEGTSDKFNVQQIFFTIEANIGIDIPVNDLFRIGMGFDLIIPFLSSTKAYSSSSSPAILVIPGFTLTTQFAFPVSGDKKQK